MTQSRLNTITYAGHSAAIISGPEVTLAIDPWLQGNPSCPAELINPKRLDLIVLTHGHADHASDAVRLAKQTGATIAATWELAMIMIAEGVPEKQVLPMNKGGSLLSHGLRISLTQAIHSSSYDTPSGPRYAGEACGVIIQAARLSIYHAGDTALFSDMSLIGETYRPRIALLPIGDRFTMGPREAATAAGLIGCRYAIPIHYGTFEALTGTAEQFQAECRGQDVEAIALTPGQSWSLPGTNG